MTTHLPLLTTSASGLYRACPRAYYLSQELGYRPAYEDDARTFGTLGHHGLEAWNASRLVLPDMPDAWLAAALTAVDAHESEPFRHVEATVLMVAYHARWSEADVTPIAVEKEYALPLINPATGAASRTWRHGGKMDAIVRNAAGDVYVMDHKFTRTDFSPGSDYRSQLILAAQVSNYVRSARALGYDCRGWIHDVIARPALRPLKATPHELRKYTQEKRDKAGNVTEPSRLYAAQRAEDETPEEYGARLADHIAANPDSYFARFEAVRLEEEEREGAFDMWQVGRQIADSRLANAWPRNPSSCVRYSRGCDFLPHCSGQGSLDDPTRYRRAVRPNEELSEEVEEVKEEGEAAE